MGDGHYYGSDLSFPKVTRSGKNAASQGNNNYNQRVLLTIPRGDSYVCAACMQGAYFIAIFV